MTLCKPLSSIIQCLSICFPDYPRCHFLYCINFIWFRAPFFSAVVVTLVCPYSICIFNIICIRLFIYIYLYLCAIECTAPMGCKSSHLVTIILHLNLHLHIALHSVSKVRIYNYFRWLHHVHWNCWPGWACLASGAASMYRHIGLDFCHLIIVKCTYHTCNRVYIGCTDTCLSIYSVMLL